jgi:NADPH-dependent 2,4-dienoyl-CoA reductase/sulfur reductase-like enzyme
MSSTITTEVLVLGAGPAGIAAATAAAEHGRRVVVLDDNRKPGGQIWREGSTAKVGSTRVRNSKKRRALDRLYRSTALLLPGRTVFNASADGLVEATCENAADRAVERIHFE